MNLLEATRHCFLNALNFRGRADRYEFWNFVLFLVLGSIVLTILYSVIFGPLVTQSLSVTIDSAGNQSQSLVENRVYSSGWFGTVFGLATILPFVAVAVRRLHDRGRPGWHLLLPVAGLALVYGVAFFNVRYVPINTTGLPPDVPSEIAVPAKPLLFLGAWLLAAASFVIVIIWLARRGQPGPNRFGSNPSEVPQ